VTLLKVSRNQIEVLRMTARRYKDFRGGDLGEDLGIFLLKTVCAVAPVPRPEDVGVDAVATLLRENGDFLLAEDSFFVQLKSSREPIVYSAEEIDWLRQLQLPFYIGYVDRATASLSLYAAMDALCWILEGQETKETRLYFNEVPKGSEIFRVSLADKEVFTWSIDDLRSEGFSERAYNVLKVDVGREQQNIRWRRYGIVENIAPKGGGKAGLSIRGGKNKIATILEDTKDVLFALGFNCAHYDRRGLDFICELIAFARHYQIEIDPHGNLITMFRLLRPAEPQMDVQGPREEPNE